MVSQSVWRSSRGCHLCVDTDTTHSEEVVVVGQDSLSLGLAWALSFSVFLFF